MGGSNMHCRNYVSEGNNAGWQCKPVYLNPNSSYLFADQSNFPLTKHAIMVPPLRTFQPRLGAWIGRAGNIHSATLCLTSRRVVTVVC